MKKITVLGMGGHARSVFDAARADERLAETVDWDSTGAGEALAFGTVLNQKRRELIERHGAESFVEVIHPDAIVSNFARIGRAVQIMAGAIIGPDVVIGDFVVVNTGAKIDHNCQIGNFVVISPGAVLTGYVTVKDDAFIGANATLIPKVIVGNSAIVGAGSVVIGDVPDGATVVGNPARRLQRREND